MHSMGNIFTVFKRELKSYFESPVAYVFMIVFLLLEGVLTFFWPGFQFFERGVADLQPFFFWLPIVYLLLVPAATMGLWAEERKTGTIELLLTMPVTLLQTIIGKFLAAWCFIAIGVLLTFPMIITVALLGSPDFGAILTGYIGAILMATAYVSVGMLASATTRNQVISFVVSLSICFLLVLAGTPFITNMFLRWELPWLIDAVSSLSLFTHYEALQRGVIDLRNIVYFLSVAAFMIAATHVVLANRKSA